MSQAPIYVEEQTVRKILTWPMAIEATKQALSAVSNSSEKNGSLPTVDQPARSFTRTAERKGVLLSMPGYVGNYSIGNKKSDSLGCKLVTAFPKNLQLAQPLPNILANIFLMDSSTGQLKCIMEGTEITAWRTTAASLNATKYLYYERPGFQAPEGAVLAIIGCGVEGRYHAIGMCSTFGISEVRLWNRTKSKAESLKIELENLRNTFQNTNVKISIFELSETCATTADIVVTATFADSPVLSYKSLKKNVHVNAIGAGINHFSELDSELYLKGQLYVDTMTGAKIELKGLNAEIIGEVGEVINGFKPTPKDGITIFQSMGMACEDVLLAEAVYAALTDTECSALRISKM